MQCRVREVVRVYFQQGGKETCLAKDHRRQLHMDGQSELARLGVLRWAALIIALASSDKQHACYKGCLSIHCPHLTCFAFVMRSVHQCIVHACNQSILLFTSTPELARMPVTTPPVADASAMQRVAMLDVGSCYDPFGASLLPRANALHKSLCCCSFHHSDWQRSFRRWTRWLLTSPPPQPTCTSATSFTCRLSMHQTPPSHSIQSVWMMGVLCPICTDR